MRLLPGALASPFAGLLGDRFPRRDVLIGSGLVVTVVLAATCVAAAMDSDAWVVAVFAGVFTAAISGYVPAEAALLPALARSPQELSAANVTHSAMDNVGFLAAALTTGLAAAFRRARDRLRSGRRRRPGHHRRADPDRARRAARLRGRRRRREISGLWRQSVLGFRTLVADSGLRLLGALLVVVVFFEGTAEVLVVILALDLLHLDHGSVGYLNAAWGIGALLGGATLSVMLGRGRLAIGLAVGSAVVALATALPALWTVAVAAYVGWLAIGLGYTVAEVAAKTLLQRLGSDETLSRVIGSLESARLAAMALGSISASVIFELFGIQGALLLLAALLPAFVALSWTRLRAFEVGAPVAEEQFQLLRGNSIFSPLPVATLERISNNLVPVQAPAGEEVITQGDPGDRFYLIEEGAGRGLRRRRLPPQRGPRRDASARSPCCATCRARRPCGPRSGPPCWRSSASSSSPRSPATGAATRWRTRSSTTAGRPKPPRAGAIPCRSLRRCRASSGGFRRSRCRCPAS